MPRSRRASAYKTTIANRTWESGGSMGGNSKPGVLRFSNYPNIPAGYFSNRTNTGDCCINTINPYEQEENQTESNTEEETNQTESNTNETSGPGEIDIDTTLGNPYGIPTLPSKGYGTQTNWSTTITNNNGSTITYHSNGSISFQGDALVHISP